MEGFCQHGPLNNLEIPNIPIPIILSGMPPIILHTRHHANSRIPDAPSGSLLISLELVFEVLEVIVLEGYDLLVVYDFRGAG